jgi:hypothetical protein
LRPQFRHLALQFCVAALKCLKPSGHVVHLATRLIDWASVLTERSSCHEASKNRC